MTWTTFHHRGEVLRAVITAADTRRDGLLPMDVDGVAETFPDELAVLGALQLKWHTRLTGQIERQLVSQPMRLDDAVVAAWAVVADDLPGVRAVIDHYREHPVDATMATAIRRATLKEQAYLATMAGLSSVHDLSGARLGAELEDRARALRQDLAALSVLADGADRTARGARADARPSLLERLRSALAA